MKRSTKKVLVTLLLAGSVVAVTSIALETSAAIDPSKIKLAPATTAVPTPAPPKLKLPAPLTSTQRLAVVNRVRQLAGVAPTASVIPAKFTLTPREPAKLGSYMRAWGHDRMRWNARDNSINLQNGGVGLDLPTYVGKTYLVDCKVYDSGDGWHSSTTGQTAVAQDGHVLFAFTATETLSYFVMTYQDTARGIWVTGCEVTQVD